MNIVILEIHVYTFVQKKKMYFVTSKGMLWNIKKIKVFTKGGELYPWGGISQHIQFRKYILNPRKQKNRIYILFFLCFPQHYRTP